ncbi:MAG: uroporphyrinogen-III synthase [Alphaproteobacteria bacterium]
MILITRLQPGADAFAREIKNNGLNAAVHPVMTVEFKPRPQRLPETGEKLAFTSANGVRAFASWTEDRAYEAFTVGDATADCARQLGFKKVTSAQGNSDDLSTLLKGEKNIVHIRGEHVSQDMKCAREIIAYEAVPIPNVPQDLQQMLKDQKFTSSTFFSPRTGQIFAELLQKIGAEQCCKDMVAVCISQKASEAIDHLPWNRILIAEKPTQQEMLNLLLEETT